MMSGTSHEMIQELSKYVGFIALYSRSV